MLPVHIKVLLLICVIRTKDPGTVQHSPLPRGGDPGSTEEREGTHTRSPSAQKPSTCLDYPGAQRVTQLCTGETEANQTGRSARNLFRTRHTFTAGLQSKM